MEIKYLTKSHTIEEAFDELEAVFSDKKVELINVTNTELTYRIRFPDNAEWYVDPYFSDMNLKEIGELPKNYTMEKIKGKFFLRTHFHYNALKAVIEYEQTSKRMIDCIIHFDDHSDMMPVYKKNSGFCSYNEKIESGELAIGNFITNYLIKNPINIYHIQNAKSSSFKQESYGYYITSTKEVLGNLKFEKFKINKSDKNYPQYSRIEMAQLDNNFIEAENIWLDIDLDYFCNRFNRDTDWGEMVYFDRTFNELNNEVRLFLEGVQRLKWLNKVKVLTIASSPGFFPYEYLKWIENCLLNELKEAINFDGL